MVILLTMFWHIVFFILLGINTSIGEILYFLNQNSLEIHVQTLDLLTQFYYYSATNTRLLYFGEPKFNL